jgi:hypothetical protein
MKKQRITLIILSLLSILSIILMVVFSQAIQEGKMSKDWMGGVGLLMSGSVIANVFLSYRYAWRIGRQAGLWALGAFLLPYVIPLILSFLPVKSSGIDYQAVPNPDVREAAVENIQDNNSVNRISQKELFTSVLEPDRDFLMKEGLFKSSQWPLDQLRLLCIIVPGTFKWRIVTSSQEQWFFFPDLMPQEEAEIIYSLLDELCSSGNSNDLAEIQICLACYEDRGTVIDLRKLNKISAVLLAGLYHFRDQRRERLNRWLSDNPQVTLNGGLGSRALLNRDGFHLKKRKLSWPEIKGIMTESFSSLFTTTHLYVLPEGRSGGFFDLKKGKYALKLIPTKEKNLFAAECHFWKSYYSTAS